MAEAWKTVGNPYWDEDKLCIDVAATGLEPDVYYAWIYKKGSSPATAEWKPQVASSGGGSEQSRTLSCREYFVNEWFSPLPREVTIALVKRYTITILDSVERTIPEKCTCTTWVNAECTAPGKRRQTRICTPAGCDIEERIIDDPTCVPSTKTVTFGSIPADATVTVD